MHKLRHFRESNGLTVKDLSILSDISVGAIHRIESGNNPYKTNEGVAFALAAALDVEIGDIFEKSELSHLGRPPHTGGKPIVQLHLVESYETMCESHNLVVPRGVGCHECAA